MAVEGQLGRRRRAEGAPPEAQVNRRESKYDKKLIKNFQLPEFGTFRPSESGRLPIGAICADLDRKLDKLKGFSFYSSLLSDSREASGPKPNPSRKNGQMWSRESSQRISLSSLLSLAIAEKPVGPSPTRHAKMVKYGQENLHKGLPFLLFSL